MQALASGDDRGYMKGMKTLEVNPRHPLVQELKILVPPAPDIPFQLHRISCRNISALHCAGICPLCGIQSCKVFGWCGPAVSK